MVQNTRKLSGTKLYFKEKKVKSIKEPFSLNCRFPLSFDEKQIEEFGKELLESIKSISKEEKLVQGEELTLKEIKAKQLERLKQIKENFHEGSRKIVRFLSQTRRRFLSFRAKIDYGVMEAEKRFPVKERWKHVERIESHLRELNEKIQSRKKALAFYDAKPSLTKKEEREQSRIRKELQKDTRDQDKILEDQEKSRKKQTTKFLEEFKHQFEELLTNYPYAREIIGYHTDLQFSKILDRAKEYKKTLSLVEPFLKKNGTINALINSLIGDLRGYVPTRNEMLLFHAASKESYKLTKQFQEDNKKLKLDEHYIKVQQTFLELTLKNLLATPESRLAEEDSKNIKYLMLSFDYEKSLKLSQKYLNEKKLEASTGEFKKLITVFLKNKKNLKQAGLMIRERRNLLTSTLTDLQNILESQSIIVRLLNTNLEDIKQQLTDYDYEKSLKLCQNFLNESTIKTIESAKERIVNAFNEVLKLRKGSIEFLKLVESMKLDFPKITSKLEGKGLSKQSLQDAIFDKENEFFEKKKEEFTNLFKKYPLVGKSLGYDENSDLIEMSKNYRKSFEVLAIKEKYLKDLLEKSKIYKNPDSFLKKEKLSRKAIHNFLDGCNELKIALPKVQTERQKLLKEERHKIKAKKRKEFEETIRKGEQKFLRELLIKTWTIFKTYPTITRLLKANLEDFENIERIDYYATKSLCETFLIEKNVSKLERVIRVFDAMLKELSCEKLSKNTI